MKQYVIVILFYLFSTYSFSQDIISKEIYYNELSLETILSNIEEIFGVKFSFESSLISDTIFTIEKRKRSLEELLFEITTQTNLQFNRINKTYYYITKEESEVLNEVLITGYLTSGISKKQDASYKLSPKKMGVLVGLTEVDILESVQQLPGVISINETATDFSVRGGVSDQNHILWDGITIYHGGHLFGMVSVFNPNIAQQISFINKGTNVKYGERVSSVIDISTSNKINNFTQFEVGMNGINADIFFKTPLIKNKLSIQGSFRRSYEDIYETKTFKQYEEKAFQHTKIEGEFFYFKDYNVKLNYQINSNNFINVSLIHIDNDLENAFSDLDSNKSYSDVLDSENDGYSVFWKKQWKENIWSETQFTHSNYRFNYDFTTMEDDDFISKFSKFNTINDYSFFTNININIRDTKLFIIGYQNSLKQVDFSFNNQENINYLLDSDNSRVDTHSFYTSINLDLSNGYNIYLGGRGNYYTNINKFKFEPRLIINKKIGDYINLQLTGEHKNQVISQIDETVLSNLSLERKVWRLADGNKFPIISNYQFTGGLSYTRNKWTFDLDLFYKKTNGLTSLSLGFLNLDDNLFHKGKQKSYGLDFYVKKKFNNNIQAWISYSFLDSKNKYDGLNNNTYFTSNTEIRNSINTAINYTLNKFQVALGWKWRTGKPLTDLDIDEDGNYFYDGINTEHLKSYHRLDISATYRFSLSKKRNTKGQIGFSIRNLYNNKNHISTYFTGNNTTDDPIKITEFHAIGITPNFMIRFYL